MGLTYVKGMIAHPRSPERQAEIEFLVDTGALYNLVPASVLQGLGIQPIRQQRVILADGREEEWSVGEVRLTLNGRSGFTPIFFGKEGAPSLLGIVSLEVLGLAVDPNRRTLHPSPAIMA